jgi:hypothetical protein
MIRLSLQCFIKSGKGPACYSEVPLDSKKSNPREGNASFNCEEIASFNCESENDIIA